jgi:hypothetical protein
MFSLGLPKQTHQVRLIAALHGLVDSGNVKANEPMLRVTTRLGIALSWQWVVVL